LKSYLQSVNKNFLKKIFLSDKFDKIVNLYGCYQFSDFDFYLDKNNNNNSFVFKPNGNSNLTVNMDNSNMKSFISKIIKHVKLKS